MESRTVGSAQYRVARTKQHVLFLTESALTFALGFLLWYATHFEKLNDLDSQPIVSSDHVFHVIWTPFLIYSGVGFTLLAMIYYGTSFQITPFRVFMPFLKRSPFLKSLRPSPASRPGKGTPKSVDDETNNGQSFNTKAGATATMGVTLAAAAESEPLDSRSIDTILRLATRSASSLASKMENRINLHLTFGVLTGGVGLLVWYMTFYYAPNFRTTAPTSIAERAFDTLPRITILIFIEILAGFFLRQYRIGVEDLKYFLELKRRADAKRIAYLLIERVNDPAAKLDFAKQLLQEKSDTRLAQGETTTALYALEKERNEVLTGLESLKDSIGSIAKDLRNSK